MTTITTTTKRFEVKEWVKFGMLFGYKIWDNSEKKYTHHEYMEDEKYRADSRCEMLNLTHS